MICKKLATLLLLISLNLLYSNTEIYDYQEEEELIEIRNNEVEERWLDAWTDNKLKINFRKDFLDSSNNRLFFHTQNKKISTQFYKQDKARIFAKYQSAKYSLGFGNYRPAFGLGSIYKRASTEDYLSKVLSKSQLDLQGFFSTYQLDSYKFSLFYSNSSLNTIIDSDGQRRIVYYDSDKIALKQSGLILSKNYDDFNLSLLTAQFTTSKQLKQLNNKERFLIFSSYATYQLENLDIRYETNYLFSRFSHSFWASFNRDYFETIWKYKSLPSYSLNWLNAGISNKYNTNSTLYSGECSVKLANLNLTLASELKSNQQINQWRSKSSVRLATVKKFSYLLQQEVYQDFQSIKQEKYTHTFKLKLFDFDNSNITFNYTLNNKEKGGVANMYQVEFNGKAKYGKLQVNLKVLDNYKNEETVEDIDENIIATFYEYSEDFLILFNYQTPKFHNFLLKSSLIHSLYNDKVKSLRIELSFLL